MWYPVKVTEQPDGFPVTVDEVKQRLRIDAADDGSDINLLIASATDHVEKYCNTPLVEREIEAKCDSFYDMARLPVAPVSEVSEIAYVDIDGADQVVPSETYELCADGLEAAIVLKPGQSWPAKQIGSRITLSATVGYDETPPAVKHGILLFIADAYAIRENGATSGWTAFDSILSNHRRGV